MANQQTGVNPLGFIIVPDVTALNHIAGFVSCYTTEKMTFEEICRKLFQFSFNSEGEVFTHDDILHAYTTIPKELYYQTIHTWVGYMKHQIPEAAFLDVSYGCSMPTHVEFVVNEFVAKDPNNSRWI